MIARTLLAIAATCAAGSAAVAAPSFLGGSGVSDRVGDTFLASSTEWHGSDAALTLTVTLPSSSGRNGGGGAGDILTHTDFPDLPPDDSGDGDDDAAPTSAGGIPMPDPLFVLEDLSRLVRETPSTVGIGSMEVSQPGTISLDGLFGLGLGEVVETPGSAAAPLTAIPAPGVAGLFGAACIVAMRRRRSASSSV